MKYFVMSDIHIDFYTKTQEKEYDKAKSYYEKFYENYMQPADILICAGDISNDYYNHVNFLKYISTKYKEVYTVFGNHDYGIHSTFGNGNPVKYSEERLEKTINEFKNTNVYILNGDIVNNIGGTMGMCDFHYTTTYDMGIPYKINQWQKYWYDSRVWHIKTTAWHSGYKINPIAILENEKQKLNNIINKQPNIIITHFCPSELGVAKEYSNSTSTAFFYFDGKPFLDQLDHETWWFCGHIHNIGHCDYVNAKGNIIHIWALPNGYPEENPYNEGAFESKLVDNMYNLYNENYNIITRSFNL